ncbi:MAG TPA: M12 family metallo-peptidase, partial [Acidobacteriota bacterium]|nr:M12 family metallo-peptidase [Acidobacteriota bacterium]
MHRLSRPFLFITALAVIGTAFWFSNSRANSGLFAFQSSPFGSTTQTGSKLQSQPELLQLRKSDDGIWQDVEPSQIQARYPAGVVQRNVAPIAFRTINLDHLALKQILQRAPMESVETGLSSTAIISLPMPDGKFARFRFVESPIMESELAARYPDMKTYAGQGIDDPTAVVRFDTVPQGFHAIILSVHGTTYIDPYLKNNTDLYASYYKRDFRKDAEPFRCLFENPLHEDPESAHATRNFQPNVPTGANLRTYRAAVATTGEYTAAAGGGTLVGGLGAVITSVNRVSAVYERELAIRLVLVNNEDKIIYTNSGTDPYSNSSASALLSENQSNLDSVIGSANYDIGHVFSTGGGGLAGLGVVCRAGQKARGETGSGNPVGDPYDIDYVAHEMGHQFGGNHPFNGNTGNCAGGNRNASTAYEVGSGNTIMAYAGICGASDIQPNSDDYFHAISYQEIDTYTSTGAGNCGASTVTGNTAPTLGSLTNFTIPNQTPFTLTASASDPNAGDVLTYCWEEFDLGPTQDPTVSPRDNGSAPIFRSYDPVTSPSRTFPALQYILNNANVPPATISLPGISGTFASGEFLPTTNRTMTFRVTVRDNRLNGGGVNRGQMTVTSTTSAGPFAVTAPNTATSVAINSALNVTWNVAGTTANGINTANVRILLSTDGGYTFPTVLAATTPNDGSQSVLIPNDNAFATTQARVKVEAIGNIFFDISNTNFTITGTNTAPTVNITSSVTILRGSPSVTTNVGTVADGQDTAGTLAVALSNLPFELTASVNNNSGTLAVTAASECTLVTTNTSKTYPITVTVTDSAGATTTNTINIVVQPNLTPTLGNYTNPAAVLPGSSRTVTPAAPPADGNNAISTVTVSPTTLPGGGTLSVDSAGVVTVNTTGGTTNGTYTVFVTAQDICGAAVVKSFTLTVSGPVVTIIPAGSTITAGNCGSPATSAIDPGETVTVSFGLQNTGTTNTSNLVATLQNSGGITPITTSQSYGGLVGGGAAVSRSYQFTANGTCGATVTATLQLQDGVTNLGNATFTFVLGGGAVTNIFTQNFDGVTAPALPSGWTTAVLTGSVGSWATTSTNPDTAANTAFTNGIASTASNALISPSIALPAGSVSAVLS